MHQTQLRPSREDLLEHCSQMKVTHGLSSKTVNRLCALGFITIGQLSNQTEESFSRCKDIGSKTLEEVKNFLLQIGFSFKEE